MGSGGGWGRLMLSVFEWSEETGRVKNFLGECRLKVTRPNGERSEILVSNPAAGNFTRRPLAQTYANTRTLNPASYAGYQAAKRSRICFFTFSARLDFQPFYEPTFPMTTRLQKRLETIEPILFLFLFLFIYLFFFS